MLMVGGQASDSGFDLLRRQVDGFLDSLSFRQSHGCSATGDRSPATVGGERSALDAAIANHQPEFHCVTARAGNARVGVGAFQRPETGRE